MTRKLPMASALTTALLIAGAIAAVPAQATTTYSWTFSSCASGSTSNAWGNTCTDSTSTPSGGPSLAANAWANTGSSGGLETAHAQYYSGGGVGVNNRDGWTSGTNLGDYGDVLSSAPEHATDNEQRVDSLLLSFGSALQLTSLVSGWPDPGSSYDTDFVLMRYMGTDNPTAALDGKTYSQLLTQSWEVIGHYSFNKDETPTNVSAATAGKSSSYWLVAADTTVGTSAALDGSSDYFKLKTIAASTPGTPPPPPGQQVPEPGSLALLGLGALLLGRVRSRKAH